MEDLPEGGTVELVVPASPTDAQQLRNMQGLLDNDVLAQEQQVAAHMRLCASAENAGCDIINLKSEPYKRADGQDYVQMDAAVVAGGTLYLAECKRMVEEDNIANLLLKQVRIRSALLCGTSPDLAAALRGVTHVKLFLAGQGVCAGQSLERLAELTAAAGVGLLLPTAEGLDLVSAPSALPL